MTKILVFGTGVLLRGLIADCAEKAQMPITMISSTPSGDDRARALTASGGKFTLRERGLASDGSVVDTAREVAIIESALTASDDTQAVLATASDPEIRLVISNVSESGFKITEPKELSFPGRLAAWLKARMEAGAPGVTVLPSELIAENGSKLRAMVAECDSEPAFLAWLDSACVFCDTLVDRICTQDDTDPLAAIVEPYTFWAIQGTPTGALGELAAANPGGIIVAESIERYQLRKVRLLNGLHTSMASIGPSKYGVETVREALEHPELGPWLESLLWDEIVPAICPPLERSEADEFARLTLLRMKNPFLVHKLSMIAVGAAVKWEARLLPTMAAYEERFGTQPEKLTACREAFLATA
jgi:tagaturonate reductase